MYHTGEQIEQAEVVIHNGSVLTTVNPPDLNETASTMFFCVGEDNYSSSSLSDSVNTGIIGSAEMRILWCGDGLSSGGSGGALQKRVWILGKNSSGNGLTNVINSPLILPNGFVPVGAVWGYFWDDSYPHRQSGFVLYNNIGNYVVVHTEFQNYWEVSSTVETGLFGAGTNPGAVVAYRETIWPVTSYSPAKDILCAVVNKPIPNVGIYMHWCSGGLVEDPFPAENHDEFTIGVFLGTAQDYNHLSFGHCWHMNKTQFFFGGDGVSSFHTTDFKHFPTNPDGTGGWAGESNPTLTPSPWGVVNNPMRVRHTRKSWVYALMPKLVPNSDLMSIRDGEMRGYNITDETSPNYASTDLYFNNLCSPGDDGLANENGAIDLEFEWGINQTTEANCLFANIQAFGKFPMLAASFAPSHDTDPLATDTLLYLTVAPIIHGCRGISFYALDMALQGGGASSGTAPMYGAPNVMLNWGPSRDCEENADIVGRVHDVVKMLTGKKGGPDFLGALVDHSNYTVLDETEAVNASYSSGSYIEDPYDKYLNFIALRDNSSGDILVLVSNDCDVFGMGSPLIFFPNEYASAYSDIECWGGWDPTLIIDDPEFTVSASTSYSRRECAIFERNSDCSALVPPLLSIYLPSLPVHTVSLLRIPVSKEVCSEAEIAVEPILQVRRSAGNVFLQLSGEFENCALSLYDLTGRKVEDIEISEGEGSDIHLNTSSHSAGMYFAVLTEEDEILQMEKISIF